MRDTVHFHPGSYYSQIVVWGYLVASPASTPPSTFHPSVLYSARPVDNTDSFKGRPTSSHLLYILYPICI